MEEKRDKIERERKTNVPNYTKQTGRTNEWVCCLDRLHSDDKSNKVFCFFLLLKKSTEKNECRY